MRNSELYLIVNGDCSVAQKLNLLTEYEEKVLKEISDAIMEVKKGYTYCEKCKQWYKDKAWEDKTVEETRTYSSCLPLAEWENPEYKNGDFVVTYSICPVGHKREINSYLVN